MAASATDATVIEAATQICFFPDGSNRFIAGEQAGHPRGTTPGWGVFQLSGDTVGQLAAEEVGIVAPTSERSGGEPRTSGCGFLADQRMLTVDGRTNDGQGVGQLIVWFPPFGYQDNRYCKLDIEIASAQSIWVDSEDNIYVASSSPPGTSASSAGVWKYTPPFPTSSDSAGGCANLDATRGPLADGVIKKKVITVGASGMTSPSGIAPAPNGNMYVSSADSGVINEYTRDGALVRVILQPPGGENLDRAPISGGSPTGLATGPDGSLYYADAGPVAAAVGSIGASEKSGSVRTIRFEDGQPSTPEIIAQGLDHPDGLGIYVPSTTKQSR